VTLRLLTYNIRHGGAGRSEAISRVISSCAPDVVLLQEATLPHIVEDIAGRTGMGEWRAYRRQSLAFLSHEPMAGATSYRPRFSRHAFIEIVLPRERARFFGVHLSALHAAWTERRRVFELRSLLRSVERHQHGFHVLAGDFNTLAPTENLDVSRLPARLRPFVWLSGGRIRWRTIQTVLDAGYVDARRGLNCSRRARKKCRRWVPQDRTSDRESHGRAAGGGGREPPIDRRVICALSQNDLSSALVFGDRRVDLAGTFWSGCRFDLPEIRREAAPVGAADHGRYECGPARGFEFRFGFVLPRHQDFDHERLVRGATPGLKRR